MRKRDFYRPQTNLRKLCFHKHLSFFPHGVCMAGVTGAAFMARGACIGGGWYAWQGGHVWGWACMAGGMHAREMVTAVGGKHPNGMHSCLCLPSVNVKVALHLRRTCC